MTRTCRCLGLGLPVAQPAAGTALVAASPLGRRRQRTGTRALLRLTGGLPPPGPLQRRAAAGRQRWLRPTGGMSAAGALIPAVACGLRLLIPGRIPAVAAAGGPARAARRCAGLAAYIFF